MLLHVSAARGITGAIDPPLQLHACFYFIAQGYLIPGQGTILLAGGDCRFYPPTAETAIRTSSFPLMRVLYARSDHTSMATVRSRTTERAEKESYNGSSGSF